MPVPELRTYQSLGPNAPRTPHLNASVRDAIPLGRYTVIDVDQEGRKNRDLWAMQRRVLHLMTGLQLCRHHKSRSYMATEIPERRVNVKPTEHLKVTNHPF